MASVLVVDDSAMVRRQVQRALSEAGFDVSEACDGEEALDKIAAPARVALIVCDVNMPRMNGLELLERLGAGHSVIPVVMLTTEGQAELIQRAKALGAKGWIMKPFKPELLVAAAKKLTSAG